MDHQQSVVYEFHMISKYAIIMLISTLILQIGNAPQFLFWILMLVFTVSSIQEDLITFKHHSSMANHSARLTTGILSSILVLGLRGLTCDFSKCEEIDEDCQLLCSKGFFGKVLATTLGVFFLTTLIRSFLSCCFLFYEICREIRIHLNDENE